MANMGYCRFENTANDLDDCLEHIHDDLEDASPEEIRAKKRLIELCVSIVQETDAWEE